MIRFQNLGMLPLFLLISACGAGSSGSIVSTDRPNLPGAGGAVDDPQGSLGGVELCDAETYRPMIGQSVSATTFPTGPRIRVYSDTAVVTQEYLPNRTNVVYSAADGKILRVFCG